MENKDIDTNKLEKVAGGGPGNGRGKGPSPKPGTSEIANRALAEVNKPYIWGGVGPDGYDASGLVSYCISGTHTRLGTTDTFMSWPSTDEPAPGDICVNSGHCGIYIGGGQMVHAPTYGQSLCVGSVQGGMVFVKKP